MALTKSELYAAVDLFRPHERPETLPRRYDLQSDPGEIAPAYTIPAGFGDAMATLMFDRVEFRLGDPQFRVEDGKLYRWRDLLANGEVVGFVFTNP